MSTPRDRIEAKLGLSGPPLQAVRDSLPAIPDHELIRRIGQGAYGEVWLARNALGTWRAVKIVYRDNFKEARPYEREFAGIRSFEPLSRSNEGFVDILQVGRDDAGGWFYYVMELADEVTPVFQPAMTTDCHDGDAVPPDVPPTGKSALQPDTYTPRTLSRDLHHRGRLPLEDCLPLGLTLSLALGHLHRHGLIHRDVKPSNIIFVGGVPKLADIGLVTEAAGANTFVGTEGFVPPEGPTSPQADLYALGKVLYEAAMGKDRNEFPEPFTQISTDRESVSLMELNVVLLRACAPDPKKRYASAEEMHADLALLHSGGSVQRRHQFERRFRIAQRVGAVAVAAALVVGAAWLWQQQQTGKMTRLAEEKTALAAEKAKLASENSTLAQQAQANAAESRQNELVARESLYAADIQLAQQALKADNLRLARSLLQNNVPKPGQSDLRGFEWRYLWHQCRSEELFSLKGHTNDSRVLAIAPDGKHLAVGGYTGGNIRLLDLGLRREITMLLDTNTILSLAFSPKGEFLASGSPNDVRLWDAQSFQEVRRLTNAAAPAVFSPDGRFLLTGRGPWTLVWDQPKELMVWDTATWAVTHTATFPVSGVPSGSRDHYLQLAFGSDPGRVAVLTGGTVRLLSCPELKELLVLPEKLPESMTSRPFLALSPDNRTLALPSPKGYGVRLWDTVENRELRVLPGHVDHIFSARFSPDGTQLATASPDQTTKLWQVATGELLHTFRGQADEVVDVAFSPDGETLASLGITESVVMLWDARTRPRHEVLPGFLWPQGFDPGGHLAALGPRPQRQPVMLDPADLKITPFPVPRHRAGVGIANKLHSLSADGRYQGFWASKESSLEVWDRRLGKRLCAVPSFTPIISFDVRRQLVTTCITNAADQFVLAAWQLPAGNLKWQVDGFMESGIMATAQGNYVATMAAAETQIARIEGDEFKPVLKVTTPYVKVAVSPDGRLLAAGSGDITLRSLPSGEVVGVLKGHTRKTVQLAFSPDSRTLASISDDHTTRLWHLATQRELLRFQAPTEDHDTFQAEFAPDGRALACYRHDGQRPMISLYFAPSFAEIAVAEGGDYRTAAGEDAPTWLAVSQELLRCGRPEEALEASSRAHALAETRDEITWWLEPKIQRHRVELLRQLGRLDEAGAANLGLLKLPARDPATPAGAVDLSAFFSSPLNWDETTENAPSDLREVPLGRQVFDGTVFDVRGRISVLGRSADQKWQLESPRVNGIRVGRRLVRLHFLHATGVWDEGIKTGDQIGHYGVHYADGRSVELPIRFNVDISDWWAHGKVPKQVPEATVAWEGFTVRGRPAGDQAIRLFKRTWENPHPDLKVTHLDFVAEHPVIQPMLIALTAE